ncbi:hypothetical protein GF348_24235 [candidate division KSB3 bacterium]|nr:hypothetical protein [candidate division KSB3 bacterium]
MKEKDIRQEVYHLLHTEYDLWPITQMDLAICPRCHAKVKPPIGRPDILVLNPLGRTIVIEVKAIRGGSFSFSDIRDEQRQWLDNWLEAGGFGYIAIGTLKRPRRLWIVDWAVWRNAEKQIKPIQKSIPVVAGKGYNRELQDKNLDMSTLFVRHELEKIPYSWELPEDHTIRRIANASNMPGPIYFVTNAASVQG